MSLWTKIRRAFGASDSRYWRFSGFLEMRLRGDHWKRAVYASGVGLGIAGPVSALLLAVAPPDELWFAFLISALFVLTVATIVFLYKDMSRIIVSLEDDGLRRQIEPLLANPVGWRDRDEFWSYGSILECGILPAARLRWKHNAIVIVVPEETLTLLVPPNIDIKQVAAFLIDQDIAVKAIQQLPPQALPPPSVGRRAMITAAILAAAGVVLPVLGGLARLAIYNDGGEVDSEAVAAALKAAPEGAAVREHVAKGMRGVDQARISPDGTWIWALTKNKQHFVWSDQQAEPVGQLEVPAAYKTHALFTPDSQRLVIVADLECQAWRLTPLERERQFTFDVTPDHATMSADGQRLIVARMTEIRQYDLETGAAGNTMPITLGPIVDTGLSADGNSLIVVQHSRILSVRLDTGAEEQLVDYPSPHRAHLHGSLAAGGRWAAMQAKPGTVLYDLTAKRKSAVIAAGPMYSTAVISRDGTRLAQGTMQGVGVWDTHTEKAIARFTLDKSTRLDLSDDGRYLLGFSYRAPKLVVWEMPQ